MAPLEGDILRAPTASPPNAKTPVGQLLLGVFPGSSPATRLGAPVKLFLSVMRFVRLSVPAYAASVFFAVAYTATLLMPRGISQTEAKDFLECLVPLFANTCLLANAVSPDRKQNTFWKLVALSCTLLLAGRLITTYQALVLHSSAANLFPWNIFPFLHMIPLIAAAALVPHHADGRDSLRYGFLDLLLLTCFWVYLYVFAIVAWETAWPDPARALQWKINAFIIQSVLVTGALGLLCVTAKGAWRFVYANLAGATALYSAGPVAVYLLKLGNADAIRDMAYVLSLLWIAVTGATARTLLLAPRSEAKSAPELHWRGWLSMLTVLSLPLLAGWATFAADSPIPIRRFRAMATLLAIFVCTALAFFRQYLVHLDRTKLVKQLSASLDNVSRLQTQFMQSEKLASLGQLAAGAAHEINNPLAAILGYTDVLLAENPPATRVHSLGEKIQDQARRTKNLVTNLLSFARQAPGEKQLLDLHTVLDSATRLRKVDAHNKSIRIEIEGRNTVLPAVRGDPNQLLQVFHHLIGNALDAMDTTGGVLLIRALAEKNSVIIEFSDTGPGLKDPGRVFDPFYTTKPIGKATGLGLSICYGIVQEHGGSIVGFNRPEGGCTFRVELPAVLASLPRLPLAPVSRGSN